MPPAVAAIAGIAAAFLFGVAAGAMRRLWRRRRGVSLDLTPWYRFGPSITLVATRPTEKPERH